jgi:hypothetical protein
MGKAYSQDLRERVMAAVDAGTGAYAAASFFRVSVPISTKLWGGGRERERRARVLGPVAPNRSSPRMTMPFAPM